MKIELTMGRYLPDIHLFHSRRKCKRFIERHGCAFNPLDGKDAQTWYLSKPGDSKAVILMERNGDWHGDAALLAHEAVHVALDVCGQLGLEGQEAVAYIAGEVSGLLFAAHEKWKREHGDTE